MGFNTTDSSNDAPGGAFAPSIDIDLMAAEKSDDSLKSFQEIYLGALSSDPTATAYGTAVSEGMIYFNTTDDVTKVHDGTSFKIMSPGDTGIANIDILINKYDGSATATSGTTKNLALVNAVATDAADIGAVAAKATQIGLLGTADAIADMNTLGTGTIVGNLSTVAGIAANVTTVAGIHANVTTVAAANTNIATVAGANSNIGTVATNIANVNSVGGVSSDVTTVAGIASNVTTVAGANSNVTTVATNIANVNNVGGSISNVNTVAGANSNISALNASGVIANIGTVASNVSNVNAVGAISSNVTTVAGVAANVTTVAGVSSNVTTVAGIAANVTTVAGINATHLGNVSGVASNVGILGTSDAVSDLNTLAAISTDITSLANSLEKTYVVTVANVGGQNVFVLDGVNNPVIEMFRGNTYIFNLANGTNANHPVGFKDGSGNSWTSGVTSSGTPGQAGATVTFEVPTNAPSSMRYYCTVHGNAMGNTITVKDSNISLVAGSIANVNTVAGINSNITTVAGITSNIATVAGNSSNITTVANNNANINTVASANSNISSVAGALSNINTAASNLSSINDFADKYRIASSAPSSNNDEGDLYYNTSNNNIYVYDGSAWQQAAFNTAGAVFDSDFGSQGIMLRGGSSGSYSVLTDNSSNWNTAFGWGNHASAGYLTSSAGATVDDVTALAIALG